MEDYAVDIDAEIRVIRNRYHLLCEEIDFLRQEHQQLMYFLEKYEPVALQRYQYYISQDETD